MGRSSRASYSAAVEGSFVLLEDLGGDGPSVTNDAENVIADLVRLGALAAGHRVLYRDSDGRWDELQHDGVRFTGFRGIGAKTAHDAMAAALLGEVCRG